MTYIFTKGQNTAMYIVSIKDKHYFMKPCFRFVYCTTLQGQLTLARKWRNTLKVTNKINSFTLLNPICNTTSNSFSNYTTPLQFTESVVDLWLYTLPKFITPSAVCQCLNQCPLSFMHPPLGMFSHPSPPRLSALLIVYKTFMHPSTHIPPNFNICVFHLYKHT